MRPCNVPHRATKGIMRHRSILRVRTLVIPALFAAAALAQEPAAPPAERGYALILADPPLAHHRAGLESRDVVQAARSRIETAQAEVRTALEAHGIKPVASL